MAKLAIKGHPTRGKEVIEILKMLGGKTHTTLCGNLTFRYYYIKSDGFIDYKYHSTSDDIILYSLEEFLEKFPYKVGDKVHHIIDNENQIITDLVWDEDEILYKTTNNFGYAYVNYLQPYKEETMEDKDIIKPTTEINLNHPCFDGRNEIELIIPKGWAFEQRDGKMFGVRKQYPKTYEECCKVLLLKPEHATYSISGLEYERHLIVNLQRLLICRNAYWKLAGEQMGLGKPWEFKNPSKCYVFTIENFGGIIQRNAIATIMLNRILVFPTKEIRDSFYENFKDLIEACKELL